MESSCGWAILFFTLAVSKGISGRRERANGHLCRFRLTNSLITAGRWPTLICRTGRSVKSCDCHRAWQCDCDACIPGLVTWLKRSLKSLQRVQHAHRPALQKRISGRFWPSDWAANSKQVASSGPSWNDGGPRESTYASVLVPTSWRGGTSGGPVIACRVASTAAAQDPVSGHPVAAQIREAPVSSSMTVTSRPSRTP
jgi:hypothetical protein